MGNKHLMQCMELDDGGSRRCLGCGQWVYGNLTEVPPGECPTPYVEPRVRIAQLEADLASANSDKEAYAQNAIDLRKQRDRLASALKDVVVASGIPLGDCSLEPGPDLLALSMDLVRRFGGVTP